MAEPGPSAQPSTTSNLTLRIASAVVMMPLALGTAYVGYWPFALFWAIAAIAILWEWTTLVSGRSNHLVFSSCAGALVVAGILVFQARPLTAISIVGLGALTAAILAPRQQRAWLAGGVVYAGALLLSAIVLRGDAWLGFVALVLLFAVVWTTDIFGYFAGRAIGGPKLMPSVSPKKTWSGAIAGAVGAMIVAALVAKLFGVGVLALAGLALVLSVVSQAGDLFESSIKRRFGAKDASGLIPGHGGVMDRLDGFWAAAVAACIIGVARGGFDDAARGLLIW
ncbi:MAG: phosphatidate cytidylyltransferase [Pseudolabrys sp.]|nr:phosphatidate cytidylyltransferase [Pseudolabrys sp.]MDP2296806.1 phosphatidate cytidylyltransferase [Pseudolabrys sp.]